MAPPHNAELERLLQPRYSSAELERISAVLLDHGTLRFSALPGGLFSAVSRRESSAHTGYHAVWVRDNVHVAHSLVETGQSAAASAAVLALADHFGRQAARFDAIIADPSRASSPAERPHVKFHANPISEIPNWSHDQNDALGYFVWIYSRMARLGLIPILESHAGVLARFPAYFQAIRFWSDRDSGHWEEARKNSASSVGVVCAGLRELKTLLESDRSAALRPLVAATLIDEMLDAGLKRLEQILPFECTEDPPRRRRYDAALLFLVYPLESVDGPMSDRIIADIRDALQGECGVRRYLGDSFWCANYRRHMRAEERTRDFSSDIWTRDRFFEPGTEAQWCLFDPILSVVFGRRYQSSGDPRWLASQTEHFNRALSQITASYQCAELWHWETADDGTNVLEPSDATPLLWTQANLATALSHMTKSVRLT